MTKISAKVIGCGQHWQLKTRVFTFDLVFPRFILAELNTHRAFSRNSASSRAIPFAKMLKTIENDPFIPIAWQRDHKGMQGTEYITDVLEVAQYRHHWIKASEWACHQAQKLNTGYDFSDVDNEGYPAEPDDKAGVTKQLCNRLLEAFMWHRVILTADTDGLMNFFKQRMPLFDGEWPTMRGKSDQEIIMASRAGAEIHMQILAYRMWEAAKDALESCPVIENDQWYMPLNERLDVVMGSKAVTNERLFVAVAMCAHWSYTVVGEEREKTKEEWLGIFGKLAHANPPHYSPMEHVMRAGHGAAFYPGNIKGFRQLRHMKNEVW